MKSLNSLVSSLDKKMVKEHIRKVGMYENYWNHLASTAPDGYLNSFGKFVPPPVYVTQGKSTDFPPPL